MSANAKHSGLDAFWEAVRRVECVPVERVEERLATFREWFVGADEQATNAEAQRAVTLLMAWWDGRRKR